MQQCGVKIAKVTIEIADTGPGISPESLPKLFDRFFQVEEPQTRTHQGLGLGLAIARQLVELHAGHVNAESPNELGGATFTVTLPLPEVNADPEFGSHEESQDTPMPLANIRVLFVEDAEETSAALSLLLSRAGAEVTSVSNAFDALAAFQKDRPDIILSDIGLPEMDGYAMIRRVRSLEGSSNQPPVPAVALTAFARDVDKFAAIDSGFDDYLIKPVSTERLIQTLSKLIAVAKSQ